MAHLSPIEPPARHSIDLLLNLISFMLLTCLVNRVHCTVNALLLIPQSKVFQMFLPKLVLQIQRTLANQLQGSYIEVIPLG